MRSDRKNRWPQTEQLNVINNQQLYILLVFVGFSWSGFSILAGARRKSPATSSICAGYFSYSKFYYSNYTSLFHQRNRDLILLRK